MPWDQLSPADCEDLYSEGLEDDDDAYDDVTGIFGDDENDSEA